MRHSVLACAILAPALMLLGGCQDTPVVAPASTRAGSYVLRATSSTNSSNAYWGAHVARTGDTFSATIGSDGRLAIAGLRVSGYATPGIALNPTSTGYTGGQNHALNSVSDPAFFTSGSGFVVNDTVTLSDTTPLTGTLGATATRTSVATTLQDSLGLILDPRPDLAGSGAGRYRLTVETAAGSLVGVSPPGATSDLLLASDGTVTLNLDQVAGDETVATSAVGASTLAGQFSIFDDATLTNIRSIPLTLGLSGSGSSRTVTTAAWTVQRNSSPVTIEEQYTLSAQPLAFFQSFAAPAPNGTYELYAGTKTADSTIPAAWLPFVNRVVAASDVSQTVTADILQTMSGSTLTDIELRLDTQGTPGVLDGSDTRLPIGQRSAGGTALVYAFQQVTPIDGSIHQGLLTTISFRFAYSGTNSFGTANARITFASSAGTGSLDFSFNPSE